MSEETTKLMSVCDALSLARNLIWVVNETMVRGHQRSNEAHRAEARIITGRLGALIDELDELRVKKSLVRVGTEESSLLREVTVALPASGPLRRFAEDILQRSNENSICVGPETAMTRRPD